ncbi:MAG: GNAT family N-acetyltransferase [Dongiaceae bacterium]
MQIELTDAAPTHAALLAALHRDAIDAAWQESAFATLLAQPGVAGWIASLDREPAGLLLVRCAGTGTGTGAGAGAGGEAEILTLAVRPAGRRRGIAKALLMTMFDTLATQNIARIFLEVAETNVAARTLYSAQGFTPIGRRPAYYGSGAGSDALVLARDMPKSRQSDGSGSGAPC